MIEWISNWAEAIIVAVIIATIIEMILPEGNSKKYIKVVIGVYILFTIISPIISNFTNNSLAVSNVLDLEQYMDEIKERQSNQNILEQENAASIKEIYMGNLKANIQNKLKAKGYIVTNLTLEVGDDENYTLNKITISLKKEIEKDDNISENATNAEVQFVNRIEINISNQDEEINSEEEDTKDLTNSEKSKIKEYLSSVYEIHEKNIIIN